MKTPIDHRDTACCYVADLMNVLPGAAVSGKGVEGREEWKV